MKPFSMKLDRHDEEMRKRLEQAYMQKHGRRVPFSEIVRDLMREKCASLPA